jgi:hypothetical protein
MNLKDIVDKALKDQNRSLSWLAGEMDKTFDGLKLGLVKGSIKYTDLQKMAEILHVRPAYFFEGDSAAENMLEDERMPYHSLRTELTACKELVATLKSQLSDKEKIISLLSDRINP